MAVVQRIASVYEIPSGQKHVLVTIGRKSELARQGDNVLFTVDQTLPDPGGNRLRLSPVSAE